MTDQEKVIKGLESVASDMQEEVDEWRDYSDSELAHGLTCDCGWWYNTLQKVRDALALLKAQEPRVMTLEEIPDAVFGWIELFGQIIPCVLEDVYDDDTVGFTNIEDGHDYLCASDYGRTWRCWDKEPTDEQREATPWND